MSPTSSASEVTGAEFAPYTLCPPLIPAAPLLADSPHSGERIPTDLQSALGDDILNSIIDRYVHQLWEHIPHVGGTLLQAEFSRAYIDLNRFQDDIDLSMFSKPWPSRVKPSEKSVLGAGLLLKSLPYQLEVHPVYSRLLSSEELAHRITHYYKPYYRMLTQQAELIKKRFGGVWHLNLHSMPSTIFEATGRGEPNHLPDFVLGNRNGTTCNTSFIDFVEQRLKKMGYTVAQNYPYQGMALISHIGSPQQNYHSLQIEIHRRFYMDEQTQQRNQHFNALQEDLAELATQIAEYALHQSRS